MQKQIETIEIFTVPLFVRKLDLDNKEMLQYCLNLEKSSQSEKKSNCGGWQSEYFTYPPKELQNLFDHIIASATAACNFIGLGEVNFLNAWININRYGDFNWPHSHMPNSLSGVYYVEASDNSGNIEFLNPSIGETSWGSSDKVNKFTSSTWEMRCKTGILYMFPSWLRHKVYPNMDKEGSRVSIAFNFK